MLKSIIKNMDKNELSYLLNYGIEEEVLNHFATLDNALEQYKLKAKSNDSTTFYGPNEYFANIIKEESCEKIDTIKDKLKELKNDSRINKYTYCELAYSIRNIIPDCISFISEAVLNNDVKIIYKDIYKVIIANNYFEYIVNINHNKKIKDCYIESHELRRLKE